MTLVGQIIEGAFRESNLIGELDFPTPRQTKDALRLYNSLVSAVYGGDAGERLTDWPLGNYERNPEGCDYAMPYSDRRLLNPPINMRLIATNTEAATIWLTARPQDGSRMAIADPFSRLATVPLTIEGNGRPIEGAASVLLDTSGVPREWIYRADLAAWLRITDLTTDEENPFPLTYDMMFTIMLAMRINPRYGHTLDAQSLAVLKQQRREFIAQYLQSRPLEIDDSISWPFLSNQSYDTQRSFNSTGGFNRGNTWE